MSAGRPRPAKRAGAPPPGVTASLAFKGTDALITLSRPATPAAVACDGVPLPMTAWHLTDPAALRVACPPRSFDGEPHTLRLDFADGAAGVDLPFRSDYRWALDKLDDEIISGWIYDALRPDSSLTLEVAGEFWPSFVLLNTITHTALADCPDHPLGGGFEIVLPPRPVQAWPELLRITVRGTLLQPFGPILRGATLPARAAAAAKAVRSLGRTATGLLAAAALPATIAALDTTPAPVRRLSGTLGMARPGLPRVDVVVPVYRGTAETLACLHSVLASGDRVAHRVVAIDDCSPEPELTAALRELAAAGRIEYLRNDINLGFVGTANRGLSLPGGADVLLLNADTEVQPGFLDRLYRAAYSDRAIATVTPLSNNATICSLPLPPGAEADPYGLDAAAVDALCREVNAGAVRDIPTAHGFCMFVKRAAIDEIGVFDAETFGAGYGEENDFSLRAFERGWRNVCAANVYVRHLGAVSFAGAREAQVAANLRKVEARYPYYHHFVADFLRTDPLHDLRNRVQKAAWKTNGRIVLFVTLALEGGAVRHAQDMMRRLTEEGCLALALCMGRDGDHRPMPTIRRWDSDEALRYPDPAPMEAALADILDLAPQFIHVQHLIDLPDGVGAFVRDCGIPYAVTLHDFFYACPRVTLLDEGGSYCGMPPVAKCDACIRQGGPHASLHPSLLDAARSGAAWREKWGRLLRGAWQVIAPSRDTAQRYAALFPGLACEVRPHFGVSAALAPLPRSASLAVAVPGAIGPQKGARQLVDLVRHCGRWDDDLSFVVIGHTDRDKDLEKFDNIRMSGRYAPEAAVSALRDSGCRVALFLSIFPETYSYTLSEALAAGLVPVAYDFGAIGERLRDLGTGVLVPPNAPPAQIVAAIRAAATLTPRVPPSAIDGHYRSLLGDYYSTALTDMADALPPPDEARLLTWPAGASRDRWCEASVQLRIWVPNTAARIALSFWVPDNISNQGVEIVWHNQVLAREFLESGHIRRVALALPADHARFLDITCQFDFVFPLGAPDVRVCAAMISAVEIWEASVWRVLDMPDMPD